MTEFASSFVTEKGRGGPKRILDFGENGGSAQSRQNEAIIISGIAVCRYFACLKSSDQIPWRRELAEFARTNRPSRPGDSDANRIGQ